MATLKKLVEAAIWAPTGCNQQEVRFVITTKKEDLNALLKAKKVVNPQAAILIYTDTGSTYYKGWWDDPHKARLQYLNAGAAAQNIILAAESLGLGALWVNVSPYWKGEHGENVTELYRRFDVPNTLKLQSAVYIGYPAVKIDLSVAKWHGKPVKRGDVDDYIVNVPRKLAILHYQSPGHDNMGSRALSEGLLNLLRERLGETHSIRLFNEFPSSRYLTRKSIGNDPKKAVQKFERLAEMMLRRIKTAHEVPEDTFGRYFLRSRLRTSRFYGILFKIGRRLNINKRSPNDIYSWKKEVGRLMTPAAVEQKDYTFRDVSKLIVEPRRNIVEKALGRAIPRIWGMRHIEKRLFELARFDTIVYNGNGYIADYYADMLVRRLFELYIAVGLEKEVIACNMSVDVKDPVLRALATHVFSRIDKIVVREPLSKDSLIEYGVDAGKISVAADAAIYCSIEKCEDAAEIIGEGIKPSESIALLFRGDRGHQAEDCAKLVDELRQKVGLNVALLSSSLGQDSPLISRVAEITKTPVMRKSTNHARFIDLLSQFKLVISERYHPCVFCIRTQTPVVPLVGNTQKTSGLFSLFPYSIDVLDRDMSKAENREAIIRASELALRERTKLQTELKLGCEILSVEADKNIEPTLLV